MEYNHTQQAILDHIKAEIDPKINELQEDIQEIKDKIKKNVSRDKFDDMYTDGMSLNYIERRLRSEEIVKMTLLTIFHNQKAEK